MKNYFSLFPLLSITLLFLPFKGKGRRGLLAALILAGTALGFGYHESMKWIGYLYSILFLGVGFYQFPLKQEVHTAVKRSYHRQLSFQTAASEGESDCKQWSQTESRLREELDEISERYVSARNMVMTMDEKQAFQELASLFSHESCSIGLVFAKLESQKLWDPLYVSGSVSIEVWRNLLKYVPHTLNRPKDRYLSFSKSQEGCSHLLSNLSTEKLVLVGQPVRWQGRLQGILSFLIVDPIPKNLLEKISFGAQLLGLNFHKISLYRLVLERSRRDGLTNLYLRRVFLERLGEEVHFSKRYGTSFSLLILDLDHFKSVNDQQGHLSGDRVLKAVAEILRASLPQGVTLCRYGGEEFAVLIGLAPRSEVKHMAENVRKSIEEAQILGVQGEKIKITTSIGIAHYLPNAPSMDELIQRADSVLYQAKRLGRNRVLEWTESSPAG